jgi:PhoH-like ATPase
MVSDNKKIYLLDTNILIHDPKALFAFTGAHVVIPSTVLEELDKFKHEGTERGRNAREAIRQLDALREQGSLHDGVTLKEGGTLQILFSPNTAKPDVPLLPDTDDNKILLTAFELQSEGRDVTFISKDLNARVKADALNIKTENYSKEYISEKEFYQGWVRISLPAGEFRNEIPKELLELAKNNAIERNEYVLAESQNNPNNYRVYRYFGGTTFKQIKTAELPWPLQPRNPQQVMAMDLLLDPDIEFICLFGPAGTGKTFLALLAGLHQIFITKKYEKLLISRPIVPLGKDIGFLPGTVSEKLTSWMLPIYDNMSYIMHSINQFTKQNDQEKEGGLAHKKNKNRKESHASKKPRPLTFDDLLQQGKISLEAITYMRGRTIPYQLILIDEAQNLDPHQIKTLVTRVGKGSKIILTGDPYQIDSPYLDFSSNGLVIASERFKGQRMFGCIFLPTSERSELSKLAGELL